MSKLTLNDDGTVTLPLRNGKESITMPEPSVAQMAEMTVIANDADAALPPVPTLADDPDAEAIATANAGLRERTVAMYSTDAPYAAALVKIVALTTAVDITLDDLPSWAASPSTVRTILSHWQSPLPGEG